jgi:FAD synthetase
MAFGTFDHLHLGHEYFLKKAKELGDQLIVVVARDSTVLKVKKHKPHQSEIVRKSALEKLGIVDKVILGNAGEDKYLSIREEKPDIIALGYDQKFFIENLKNEFNFIKIIRIEPYEPDTYKSSRLTPYE